MHIVFLYGLLQKGEGGQYCVSVNEMRRDNLILFMVVILGLWEEFVQDMIGLFDSCRRILVKV